MELAVVTGNSQKLFKLIRDAGGRRTSVTEVAYDRDGNPINGEDPTVGLNTPSSSLAGGVLMQSVRRT